MWTDTHVIRKRVWLILNTWLLETQTKQRQLRNVSVAAVIRLLGRLGQQGLKENLAASVENLTKSIIEFGTQKVLEDMPWEVQLSLIYASHDLAPSNPKTTLKTLQLWQQKFTKPVPPAVTKCISQISFLSTKKKFLRVSKEA
ncbi:little elongation complex subunit 1-like [Silurus meridionalis]|uniref:little elongation complex subunit 1-like n=1 Tax=Silurus meridionalis TaxID=175797 RepID=UPI001EEB7EE9|nr:little elongation complex subunit 1-like [Silurus meridionalis]